MDTLALGAVLRRRPGGWARLTPRGDVVTAKRARVLLVEDDAAVRSALVGALEAAGFEATGVGDAVEALGALGQHRIDVVVADYHLPGITGLDLLAAIKGSAPRTPLILYSGGMTDELAEEARDFGVLAVLEKPVSNARLVEVVQEAVAGHSRG
jgi:DNA-binding NtrC family response regulator